MFNRYRSNSVIMYYSNSVSIVNINNNRPICLDGIAFNIVYVIR